MVHPNEGVDTGNSADGTPTTILITDSRIFIIGRDGGSQASARSLLVALRLNGTLDPNFNPRGTHGVIVTGIGSGSSGQLVAPMSDGSLLVGGSYSAMDCGILYIDEYRPSGDVNPRFKPILLSGTSSNCGGETLVPGFESAQLTNLLPLPRGEFDAVGYASTPPASQPATPSLGIAAAFVIRFHADGSIDRSHGRNGFVLLPGLVQPMTPYNLFTPQTMVGPSLSPMVASRQRS